MVIHSVTPLEFLQPQMEAPTFTCQSFDGGFLEGQEGPDGFTISRVISTDPAVYLKKEFSPGSVYRAPGGGQAPGSGPVGL